MSTNCGYTDLFPIDPLETVDKQVIWICEGLGGSSASTEESYDTIYATWTINPDYANCEYRWILYVNGNKISDNSPSLISIEVPENTLPTIAAVAVPTTAPAGIDPLAGSNGYNIRSLNYEIARPIRVDMKILDNKIKIYYQPTVNYHNHIIINDDLVDTEGTNGKEYSVEIDPDNIELYISVVPLPFIAGTELFECTPQDVFGGLLCPDVILSSFRYVPFMPPLQESIQGEVKNNYIATDLGVKGVTINRRMTVGKRKVIRNGKFITKPAKTNQLVKEPQDYRFFTQFDKTMYYTISRPNNPIDRIPCFAYRLSAQNTANKVNMANRTYPTSLLSNS